MENAKYASAHVHVHAYVHVASSSRYGESLRHACTGDVRTQGVLWLWQQRKTQNIVTGVTIKISAFLETVTIVSPCMHVHTFSCMLASLHSTHDDYNWSQGVRTGVNQFQPRAYICTCILTP